MCAKIVSNLGMNPSNLSVEFHMTFRPVFVLRLGKLDMKGLLRTCGMETIMKFTLSVVEQGLIKTAKATKMLGAPIRLPFLVS